ncbi:MAG TPA: hypothetical protein V6C85_11455 [Allocoleopsis sp.]
MKLGVLWRNLGNSVVYYPTLAKVTGGVTASILFCHLFHLQSQSTDRDRWVRVTIDEIEHETGLSPVEQELARRQLVKRSLLKERVANGCPDRLEFWPDIDTLEQRLNDCWENDSRSPTPQGEVLLPPSNSFKSTIKSGSNNFSPPVTPDAFVDVVAPQQNAQSTQIDRMSSSISTSVEVMEDSRLSTRRIKTDKFFPVQRQRTAVTVTPHYQFSGPWKSPEEFEEFQRALLEYFKQQGVEHPAGWVFRIVDGMSKGLLSPFWDEFVAGIPLGESQKIKRDWELEPGVPYPAFEEERTQYYVQKGEPLEAAVSKARADLRNPVLGKDLWEGFLRKCDRVADEAIKAKRLGVSTPYLPPSFTDKPQITKQSVIEKLSAVSPQSLLNSSNSDSPSQGSLKQQDTQAEKPRKDGDVPSLSALQAAYKTPMGRTLVKRQIAEHPEWGYGIVDGQVVDLFPF